MQGATQSGNRPMKREDRSDEIERFLQHPRKSHVAHARLRGELEPPAPPIAGDRFGQQFDLYAGFEGRAGNPGRMQNDWIEAGDESGGRVVPPLRNATDRPPSQPRRCQPVPAAGTVDELDHVAQASG